MLPLTISSSVGGVQVVRRFSFPSAFSKAPCSLGISGFCSFVPSTPPHFRPPNVVVAAAPAGESHGGAVTGLSGSGGLAPGHSVSGGGSRSAANSIPSAGAAATGSSSGNCGSSNSEVGTIRAGTGYSTRGQVRATAVRTVDPVVAAASAKRTLSATPRSATAASVSASAAGVTAATTTPVVTNPGTYSSVDSMDDGGSGGVRLLVVVGVVLLDDPEWTQATAGAAANKGVAAPSASGAEAVAAASGTELGPISCSGGASVAKPVRVLLAQRPEGKSNAGLWEFPGGKVDPGETPEEALIRELREELGITVDLADLMPLTFASHTYPTFHLLMPLYGKNP
ncbi:hypothetical protein Vafri_13883 [Volvox africanus]|uniref:8-oxo-dGTP diphosphatase n=1 Tax=Volvox africanus TaxID=51714 RepID=A0A8J4F3A0_9CHLO|nr:hypothetical protein Vafri_13883 [Volvox africanus]